ncbi:NBS-LRR protein [Artemisia annua]|uniref:NBS-LRR protein n=1 Tax=Artemisia annua TaxID=35608 RepID=A0A2U1MAA0_ARTAN|nr:NBS-LRR protein [Artemisia annua]
MEYDKNDLRVRRIGKPPSKNSDTNMINTPDEQRVLSLTQDPSIARRPRGRPVSIQPKTTNTINTPVEQRVLPLTQDPSIARRPRGRPVKDVNEPRKQPIYAGDIQSDIHSSKRKSDRLKEKIRMKRQKIFDQGFLGDNDATNGINTRKRSFNGISKDYKDHGDPIFKCADCDALLWHAESVVGSTHSDSGSFSLCCGRGKVMLTNEVQNLPQFVLDLITGKNPKSEGITDYTATNKKTRLTMKEYFAYHYLKQLFAYCSLFPKDYAFDKQDLVLLWMAEGFFHQLRPSKSTVERLGNQCFDELLSRSFFQHSPNDESLFVMHDLMNDLATSVAGDFYFRLEKELGKIQALDKCRHMSFVYEKYVAYKKFEVFEGAKGLRTFLSVGMKESWQRDYLSNKVLVDLLSQLPLIRVISLSGYAISEVPESIGSLRHLRYFNLSRTKIKHLPESICDLYNLETLIVFGCSWLTSLPNSFFKLKNLRHLDIRHTPLLKDLPLGVAKLKSLQTLSRIIIGGKNGFSITQLKDFENLHGKVSIEGLEKVKNATEALEADLSQKRLTELEVEWSDVSDASRKDTTEKDVLDALKPYNDCLKRLSIANYLGLEFPKWVGDPSFHHLASVFILRCRKCTSLPPLGQLPSLKGLFIHYMDAVKDVGLEFLGTGVAFPSLERLTFQGMPGWEVWSTNSGSGVGDSVFPRLQELRIEDCPNLVEFSLEGDSVFPSLQNLCVKNCSNLVKVSLKAPLLSLRDLRIDECGAGLLRSLVHAAPSVTNLEIVSISGLTNEVWGGVILDLKAVEELKIKRCDEIRYLWESKEAEVSSKFFVNLRKLDVWNCKNLVSLGEKDEEEYNYGSNLLTSLRSLEVRGCENFKHLSCPNNIETLRIRYCYSMACVSFSTGGGQKLKSVEIYKCKKLLLEGELGEGGEKNRLLINSKSMPMLEFVSIQDHPDVASIIEFGGNFIHLTSLTIRDCKSTAELFTDFQLTSLASLTTLIVDCPGMDAPTGLWPPNLRVLSIGRLKSPISEWGPQKFPTTLVELTLIGEAAVTNWSELSNLHIPSSLTSLEIRSFDNLETVSEGLQHLTSLQHLEIKWCPNLKELPVALLPSLLSLVIQSCPDLKERCSRGGSYWPQIYHIPCIIIGEE